LKLLKSVSVKKPFKILTDEGTYRGVHKPHKTKCHIVCKNNENQLYHVVYMHDTRYHDESSHCDSEEREAIHEQGLLGQDERSDD
jgi:hypothetical protein